MPSNPVEFSTEAAVGILDEEPREDLVLLADEVCDRVFEFDFTRSVRSVAELVFEALQAQGADSLPGRLLSAEAKALDVAGEHLWLRLPLAQLTQGPLTFDAVHPRVGELVFTAGRALLGMDPGSRLK